jgi:epoxyqueuosine reductase
MSCVSFITSKSDGFVELAGNSLSEKIGNWIYGCDECQNACPFNRCPEGRVKFPGLDVVAAGLSLGKIIDMDEEFFKNVVQPKFWYIGPDMLWMWKVNALNAMKNGYQEEYAPYIRKCVYDPNERVSRMAKWVCETRHI